MKKCTQFILLILTIFLLGCKDKTENRLDGYWQRDNKKPMSEHEQFQIGIRKVDGKRELFAGWFDGGHKFNDISIKCKEDNCIISNPKIQLIMQITFIDKNSLRVLRTTDSMPDTVTSDGRIIQNISIYKGGIFHKVEKVCDKERYECLN